MVDEDLEPDLTRVPADRVAVRSILVPALTFDLGERTWWPARMRRETAPAARAAGKQA